MTEGDEDTWFAGTGRYWSSRADLITSNADYLDFYYKYVNPLEGSTRDLGYSLRCLSTVLE